MKQKKIETLGQFMLHLIDDEEGKQIRKSEDGDNKYKSWVCKQIDKCVMDEENPQLTFEIIGSESVLGLIFHPMRKSTDSLCNSCYRCMERMRAACKEKIGNNKNYNNE